MLLKYGLNADTQLPELIDSEQLLQPHEWKRWNDEMSRHVNLQALHDGLEIEFPKVRDLPTRFRLRKEAGPSNRVPNYTLESVQPWSAPSCNGGSASRTPQPWPQQFLAEVRERIEAMEADKESRPGLLYLLDDLAELVRRDPSDLALQLVHALAAIQYLRHSASPDQHRRALTYYEICLEALDAALFKELRNVPPTFADRLAGLFAFLRLLARGAARQQMKSMSVCRRRDRLA